MRFESWPFLFLLLLLPLFYRFWLNRSLPPRVTFPVSFPASVSASSPVKKLLWLKLLGVTLIILALARPQTSFRQTSRHVSGIDIMLALDVSMSMQIEDLAESSRIDIAKKTLQEFVQRRKDDRIGFMMFSGEPLTMAPPTLDYGLLLKSISEADTGILKDGTAIGDGLALAVNHLKDSKARSRVIILLTDGDNNLGQVDPATAGEIAAGYGIRVYTIAIGREGRVKMPIRHKSAFGQTITTYQWFENALNPELLQIIAKTTKAKFYRVTDANTLDAVFREIDQLEKTEISVREHVRYDEAFPLPLKLGVVFLLFEQILALGFWRVFP